MPSFVSGLWLRKLAQFSSPAPQLVSTPHLTRQRPLLCGPRREGRGDPSVGADESEAAPPRIQAALGAGEGGTGSKGAQLNVHLEPVPSKQLIAYGGGKAPAPAPSSVPGMPKNANFAMENIITAVILFFHHPRLRGW